MKLVSRPGGLAAFEHVHLSAAVPPCSLIAMRNRGPRELFKLVVCLMLCAEGFLGGAMLGAMAVGNAKWWFPDGCPCHESCSRQAWDRVWKCASYISEEPPALHANMSATFITLDFATRISRTLTVVVSHAESCAKLNGAGVTCNVVQLLRGGQLSCNRERLFPCSL